MGFVWVLIPIVLILAGAWSEWLKFKAKQTQLGSSSTEMERALEKMTEQNAGLIRRVQNLETIVTSQSWDEDALDRSPANTADTSSSHARLPETTDSEHILDKSSTDNEFAVDEVARLAKRLQS